MKLAAALSTMLLAVGCSADRLAYYPAAVADEETFCSEECLAARAADCGALWARVDPEGGVRIEECIQANCMLRNVCGESLWEPQCYVDCVRLGDAEVQEAVADAIECEVPVPECG